jgi:hypothetical protein
MAACVDSRFWLRAIGVALTLGMAGCSGAQTTAATGAEASATAVCKGDTEPKANWVSPPNLGAIAQVMAATNRTRWRPISSAWGTIQFTVAADGKVQDITISSAYPESTAMREGWTKFMAPVIYPPSAAGGPYIISITINASRVSQ